VAHAFDPALPIERPLSESLAIYAKRIGILLVITAANGMGLTILWLIARHPIFSVVSIFCLVATAVIFAVKPLSGPDGGIYMPFDLPVAVKKLSRFLIR
jgi:hypothetical protein